MIVVSRTTMNWAPAMTTRIHQWARVALPSSVPASISCSVVTGSPRPTPPGTVRASSGSGRPGSGASIAHGRPFRQPGNLATVTFERWRWL